MILIAVPTTSSAQLDRVSLKFTDVSGEHSASIFRVEVKMLRN
jgi:hypothetical protein